MTKLSITQAWNESAEYIGRHFGALFTVALALLVLPDLVPQLLALGEDQAPQPGLWFLFLPVVAVLGVAGNLALSSLALGREVMAGRAIAHGFRRTLPMLGASLLIGLAALILLIVLAIASGVDLRNADSEVLAASGRFRTLMLVFFLVAAFFVVRLAMVTPAAAAEPLGPIGILKRSWTLTGQAFWKLLALFVLLLILGFVIALVLVAIFAMVLLALGEPQSDNVAILAILLLTGIFKAALAVCFVTLLSRIYVQLAGDVSIKGT
ncbi:MAG: hypothetical protein QOE79_1132 [Sphingomonadales bacterium]|jgi:hypothetical protein|nr:hypothetical protein [Sphingomonadales bacterium]